MSEARTKLRAARVTANAPQTRSSILIAKVRRIESPLSHSKHSLGDEPNRQKPRLVLRVILALLLAALTLAPLGGRAFAKAQASSAKPVVAPNLAQQFAKFKSIRIPFNSNDLTPREKQMVEKLVDAAGLLDCIYWRQSDPEGLKLYLSLANSKNPQDQMLREYLKINGGRFDLIDDNKPFVGTQPMPPGRGFFPPDLTRSAFDAVCRGAPRAKSGSVQWSDDGQAQRFGSRSCALPFCISRVSHAHGRGSPRRSRFE